MYSIIMLFIGLLAYVAITIKTKTIHKKLAKHIAITLCIKFILLLLLYFNFFHHKVKKNADQIRSDLL